MNDDNGVAYLHISIITAPESVDSHLLIPADPADPSAHSSAFLHDTSRKDSIAWQRGRRRLFI